MGALLCFAMSNLFEVVADIRGKLFSGKIACNQLILMYSQILCTKNHHLHLLLVSDIKVDFLYVYHIGIISQVHLIYGSRRITELTDISVIDCLVFG